jgi:hypothetical protein
MGVDVASILYSVIDEIGRSKIRIHITENIAVSETYCNEIMSRCRARLGKSADPETLAALCKGLLHFMLTISLLPSQRKLDFDGVDIDIVVPSARTLRTSPEKSIVILVIKRKADIASLAGVEALQPNPDNIWIVSSSPVATIHRNYTLGDDNSFARIIKDIDTFVRSKGIAGLRLFHGD